MFEIHVFDVKLGDSIILKTEVEDEPFYSIIDCKKVGNKTPLVEFLEKQHIKNIHSLFLTHFHRDHCSGLPQLRDYLFRVKGTLEYYISPYIPEEITLLERLLKVLYDKISKEERKSILTAISDIQQLPSKTHEDHKVLTIRMNFEGDSTENSWKSNIHPGLLFSPVHPNPQEAFKYLNSSLKSAETANKTINSLSHVFMIQYRNKFQKVISLFTGDLEGNAWRTIKNRCLNITNGTIRSNIGFFKVPHHGGFNLEMGNCLPQMVDKDTTFVASISCPPGSKDHPSKELLEFFKNNFQQCQIVCTNVSGYCYGNNYYSKALIPFEQSAKEAEFLEFVLADQETTIHSEIAGQCAGNHTFTVTDKGFKVSRASGASCGFHQAN